MKPIRVNLKANLDVYTLRKECIRLSVPVGSHATTIAMKHKLRKYAQDYRIYLRWKSLAEAMYGADHGIDTSSLDSVVDGVNQRLYERLESDQYVQLDSEDFKLLRDPVNDQYFVVTCRQNNRVVNTRIYRQGKDPYSGSCAIVFAARCAYLDVDTHMKTHNL